METTKEMQAMLAVIKNNDVKFRKDNSLYKTYYAPVIPDKIMRKLIKYFDNHLPAQSIVAFYDESLFSTCKSGIIFTTDGFYTKFMGKAVYIQYATINSMFVNSSNNICVQLSTGEMSDYTVISAFDGATFKNILEKLIAIDAKYGQASQKRSGTVQKIDIPKDMMDKCHKIIHTASTSCGAVGTGFAQLPTSDNAVIAPIQILMITALGKVFDLDITESVAKSLIASCISSIAGRTISQFLVGWIPVLGNAINTATAAGITESIGWVAVSHFYQRWIEDKNKGRFDGMKDGYQTASGEYERKLRKQAEDFLNQLKDVRRERNEYEALLSEYEAYIKRLEAEGDISQHIEKIKGEYKDLQCLKTA